MFSRRIRVKSPLYTGRDSDVAPEGMTYLLAKAVHLIGMVVWFAGLFYSVRLFIYHVEANERPEPERSVLQRQYTMMENRLWNIITTPGMVVTLVFGAWLTLQSPHLRSGWLHTKLFLVGLLVAYHLYSGRLRKNIQSNHTSWTSYHLRMWNEAPTLLLVAIVFLAVFKSLTSVAWGVGGLLTLGVILMVAIRLYRRARETRPVSEAP